jgi:FkbM family methyltransferase
MRNVINTQFGHYMAEWFGRHRRAWFCRQLGEASYFLWRAYENRNLNMHTNGEEWLLRELRKCRQMKHIFDVGANVGDWLTLCRKHHPNVSIHAFEIAPPTFSKLRQNTATLSNITLNSFGLSDCNGEIDVFLDDTADYLTSVYREVFGPEFEAFKRGSRERSFKTIEARVVRGDDYALENKIPTIDLLKIDVEGMEKSVLRGFNDMFQNKTVQLVQFEYNTTNIASKFLLRDAYQFFSDFGYSVGKLYPNYVEFRNYHYRHEDFCGLNMIAVHKENLELQKMLGNPS